MTKSTNNIRIVFWGTAEFAVPFLRRLTTDSRFEIVAVVTKPDEPVGRTQRMSSPPVKSVADEIGLRVLQPTALKTDEWHSIYAGLKPDVAVVVAYGKLIPDVILAIPTHKTLNVHPSLLPKYRGPSPIQAAIANGDAETGITIMVLDAEMDHGPILSQELVPLTGQETTPELEARLAEFGSEMAPRVIANYVVGTLQPKEQDHSHATTTKLLSREDGKVDWSKTALEIERLHRAYQPWPGIWTEWRHKERIIRIKLIAIQPTTPGNDFGRSSEIVDTAKTGLVSRNDGKMVVTCGTGSLSITSLQPEGKNEMSAEEFLRGHPDIIGAQLRESRS